jgi:transposase
LSVANLIDNFVKGLRGQPLWLVWLLHKGTNLRTRVEIGGPHISSPIYFPPARVSVSSTIMAPPLDAATHILIETLLTQGFENKLIASNAKCSKRAVQKIRRKRRQPEMLTPRTKRGRRSCITPPMKKTFFDTLTEQPYLYRCEMADLLYRRYRRKISERSIGRILRSTG